MLQEIKNIKWYALYVRSRSEKSVGELLQKKGVEVYVPLIKTMRQWTDRKKMVEIPLFSGYVFVKTTAGQSDFILRTKGIVGFVKYLGKNAAIRDIELSRIKQLVELGYEIETSELNKRFQVGEKIQITSGPLKGIEGYVMNLVNSYWLEIALESLGQVIKVKLPEGILKTI